MLKLCVVFFIIYFGFIWVGLLDLNLDIELNFYFWKVLIKKIMGVGIVFKCFMFLFKLNLF